MTISSLEEASGHATQVRDCGGKTQKEKAPRVPGVGPLVSTNELSVETQLPPPVILRWVKERKVSAYRMGRRSLYFSVRKFLEEMGRFEAKAVE